jgi:hypothetical protein
VTASEHTTAATDLLLAVVVVAGIVYLWRVTMRSGTRTLWLLGLAAFAAAALLGAALHGVTWLPGTRTLLWQPLYLLLGTALACFVAGAIADWRGYPAGRRALPFLLVLALGFYGATRLASGAYLVFVLFQAAALLFALWIYGKITLGERRPGAGLIFSGLLLTLAGGVVQAMEGASITLIWRFDHNGLYHLIQLCGVLCIVAGLRHTLGPRSAERT